MRRNSRVQRGRARNRMSRGGRVRKFQTGGHTHNMSIPFRQHIHHINDPNISNDPGWTQEPMSSTYPHHSFDGSMYEGNPNWLVEEQYSQHPHRPGHQQSRKRGGRVRRYNNGGSTGNGHLKYLFGCGRNEERFRYTSGNAGASKQAANFRRSAMKSANNTSNAWKPPWNDGMIGPTGTGPYMPFKRGGRTRRVRRTRR